MGDCGLPVVDGSESMGFDSRTGWQQRRIRDRSGSLAVSHLPNFTSVRLACVRANVGETMDLRSDGFIDVISTIELGNPIIIVDIDNLPASNVDH